MAKQGDVNFMIEDLAGRMVMNKTQSFSIAGVNEMQIQNIDFTPGVYLLKIQTQVATYNVKIVAR